MTDQHDKKPTYYNRTYLICFLIIGVFIGFIGTSIYAGSYYHEYFKDIVTAKNSIAQADSALKNNVTSFGTITDLNDINKCDGLIFSYKDSPNLCLTWHQIYNLAKQLNATELSKIQKNGDVK